MFASRACNISVSIELIDCVGAGDELIRVALELGAALGMKAAIGRAVGVRSFAGVLEPAVGAADGEGVGSSVLTLDGIFIGAVEGNIVVM